MESEREKDCLEIKTWVPVCAVPAADCFEVGPRSLPDLSLELLVSTILVRVFIFPLEVDLEKEFEARMLR